MPIGSNGEPIGVTFKGGIPFVNGGSTAITQAYRTFGPFTASYTNVTSAITSIDVSRWAPDDFGFRRSASAQAPTPTTVIDFGVPGSVGALMATTFSRPPAVQSIRQTIPGSVRNYGLDVAGTLLPWLARPSYDAATRRLVTPIDTVGATSALPDAVQLTASYRRTDTTTNTETVFTWVVYTRDVGDITLPVLPQELAALAPAASDQVTVSDTMFESDTVDGYDAVRNHLDATFRAVQDGQRRAPGNTVRVSSHPATVQ